MSGPRYPAIPPAELNPAQRVFYDEMQSKMDGGMGSTFTLEGKDGGLLGPLSIMMYTPEYSTHTMRLNKEVLNLPALEPAVTEVAILAVQGHYTGSFGGGFLSYSHSRIVASKNLLTEDEMKQITAGQRPETLGEKEGVAFDLAMRLVQGGKPLEQDLWERANAVLGKDQTLQVIQLVAYYSLRQDLQYQCAESMLTSPQYVSTINSSLPSTSAMLMSISSRRSRRWRGCRVLSPASK